MAVSVHDLVQSATLDSSSRANLRRQVSPSVGARTLRLIETIRRNETLVDYICGFLLLVLAIFGTRVTQLQYQEAVREFVEIRPGAQAAAEMSGAAGEGGRKILSYLDEVPPPMRSELAYGLAFIVSAPIAFRRRAPEVTHVLVFSAFLLTLWFVPMIGQVAAILAWMSTYFFAAHARWSRHTRTAFICVTVGLGLAIISGFIRNAAIDPAALSNRDRFAALAFHSVFFGSAIAIGSLIRRFQVSLETLRVQTEKLQAQHLELERTATLNERVRIAREVHDVVAHHVSVMGMHAGAARMTLGPETSKVAKSLETIERASREAVTDLHRLLSFLRSEKPNNGESPLEAANASDISSPQPNLSSLPSLIDLHRSAGFNVNSRVSADLTKASPAIELAVFRIVQEALTNIRKHSERSDEAIIDIWSDSDWLRIQVENIPAVSRYPVSLPEEASGHGIRGMRERATLHNGEFSAQVTATGGFVVRAVLPLRG
jgi:signal transduction histidine kinase